MEQKRPADIFQEFLDYLWNGLGLEEKGWKRLKKGDFKKKMKNGLTYQVWFDRSRYNYIDYEIGYGNVEVGFSCIIKQGDDRLYSFKIEPTTGGSFFRMLTEDLRLNTRLLDTFLPLIKAHYHQPAASYLSQAPEDAALRPCGPVRTLCGPVRPQRRPCGNGPADRPAHGTGQGCQGCLGLKTATAVGADQRAARNHGDLVPA